MSMPVKLSSDLVEAARHESARADRSITAQIEHWARIGRAAEQALPYETLHALKARQAPAADAEDERQRVKLLESIGQFFSTEDRSAALRKITASGAPTFEAHPSDPERVVRVGSNGERQVGRMIGREFKPDLPTGRARRLKTGHV